MATVGDQLTAAETGWKRIEQNSSLFTYVGTWADKLGASYASGGSDKYTTTNGSKLCFNFTGTKLRIISYAQPTGSSLSISIDGQASTFSTYKATSSGQIITYENTSLEDKEHVAVITFTGATSSFNFYFDAIDIDANKSLLPYDPHVISAKTKTSALRNLGDTISFEYTAATAGALGTFANIGAATKSLIPAAGTATPDGKAYFIFAGYDTQGRMKLIADRNLQTGLTWDAINTAALVSGVDVNIGGVKGVMRLLSGGVTTTDTEDEWDKIIVGSTLGGTITAGDNAVWNWSGLYSWTSSSYSSAARVRRGNSTVGAYSTPASSESSGFRPVLLIDAPKSYFLFRKEDGTAHKFDGSAMVQVTSDWSALSSTDKETAFLAASTEFPPSSLLAGLGKYKPMVYSVDTAMVTPSGAVSASPKDRAVIPKALISLAGFEGIDKATLTNTLSGAGAGVVAVTTDLTTYKTLSGGAWVDIDISNISAFKSGGITPAVLTAITRAQWDSLTTGKQGIGFAYLPTVEVAGDVAIIADLSLTVDMKGAWTRATHATDFSYSYPKNNLLRVQLLTSGDYKVNYHESATT